MTPTRVLTLWQPWAALLVDPDLPKTIETRPRRTTIRGWVLINAAARAPEWHDNLGGYSVRYDYIGAENRPVMAKVGRGAQRCWDLPLGAVVGAVYIDDCLPIVTGAMRGPHDRHRQVVLRTDRPPFTTQEVKELWIEEGPRGQDVTDQLPHGDFTPGRYGWTTSDRLVLPEPIPWRGAQGWQHATDDLIARVVAQVGPDRFGGPDAG